MTKNEYEYYIVCKGNGCLPKGHVVGKIAIKSKTDDVDLHRETVYQKLAGQMYEKDARHFFDIRRV